MSKGRRYNPNKKLNIKKVFAVVIAIVVVIMFVFVFKMILSKDKGEKILSEAYYTAYEESKYGVINSKGDKVIEPSYAEFIVIPNHQKDVFLCTYDVNYETNEYKTKALNAKNEEILQNYEQIEALDNYDSNQNIFYDQNALKVKKEGKYGLIDFAGKEILPCEYTKIETLKGVENSILVEKDGKVGLADSTGKVVIEPTYKTIMSLGEDYKLGYIVVNDKSQYGIVDTNNKMVIEPKYEEIKSIAENNQYVVKENKKWKVINKEGADVLTSGFDDIKAMSNNEVIVVKANRYGVLNTSGAEIVKAEYDEVSFAFANTYIVKKEGKYGVINKDGQMVIEPTYTSLIYQNKAGFLQGMKEGASSEIIDSNFAVKLTGIVSEVNTEKGYLKIRMDEEYHYYNFKFEEKKNTEILTTNTLFLSKKDGKYGFVDKNNKVVVDYQYDDATEQNIYGYAAVNKEGKWGSIDKKGKVVQEASADLSNYLTIDFIANWHLGENINMEYYTK